jgi:hypothetical protein
MIPPKLQKPSGKAISSLWIQLPDIHPTKVLFIMDKLPDGLQTKVAQGAEAVPKVSL